MRVEEAEQDVKGQLRSLETRWPGLFRPGNYSLDYLGFFTQNLGMAQRKETPSPAPEPDPPPSEACWRL